MTMRTVKMTMARVRMTPMAITLMMTTTEYGDNTDDEDCDEEHGGDLVAMMVPPMAMAMKTTMDIRIVMMAMTTTRMCGREWRQ